MSFTLRPAVRQNTPMIVGLAGPTKGGKTLSALRLAVGLANGGKIAMMNAEGARGHQYADKFQYEAVELVPPYRPEMYTEALTDVAKAGPAVVIIDSISHMHDGPGGILEYHEDELDKMAGKEWGKRQKATFAAWVKPKAAENQFIYAMLGMRCPVILCMRAKEKLKIVPGKDPIDLGWQPIVSDRVSFETMFTLMLPPRAKGVPDRNLSDLRDPFDKLIPFDAPLDEALGRQLAAWAAGGKPLDPPKQEAAPSAGNQTWTGTLGRRADQTSRGKTFWRFYSDEGGMVFATYEAELATRAFAHVGTGEIIKVTYRQTEKGKELIDVEDQAGHP